MTRRSSLPETSNSKTVIGGATADLARVTAVVGSALDLSLDQASNAWGSVGQGQALAYRVNAWANSDQITEHRIDPQQTPVGIQDLAAHQALLAGNNELYRSLDGRGELEYSFGFLRQVPLLIGALGLLPQLMSRK